MAKRKTSNDAGNKAARLTAEAGKVIQHGAFSAVHSALILARKTVRAADQALQEAKPQTKRKAAKTLKKAAAATRRSRGSARRARTGRARKIA